MSFFYATAKAEASKPKTAKKIRLEDIPVASLQKMSCEACPRDKDKSLVSAKLKPSGTKSPLVYLLGTAPSVEEDEDNNHWTDKAGKAVYEGFGKWFMDRNVRSNFIQQCRGDQTQIEVECCRGRIIADIEASKPPIIVGIGDAPLQWATECGGNAIRHRGSRFVVKIGNHVCWYIPIIYPSFVNKKQKFGRSEYEICFEHDIAAIKKLADDIPTPHYHEGPYDGGIEIITGREVGDMQRLEKALARLAQEPLSALDIETSGLRPYMIENPLILTAAVGTFKHTVAFSLEHPEGWGSDKQRKAAMRLFLGYIMASGKKAVHNLAFEMEWFAYKFGAEVLRKTEWDDTMAIAHTLDERGGTKSLDHQTRLCFGFSVKSLSNLNMKQPQWWLLYDLVKILKYNALDTKWTDLLRTTRMAELNDSPDNIAEYERKVRLASTLVWTETRGLPADMNYAVKLKTGFTVAVAKLETDIAKTTEVKAYVKRFGAFSPTATDQVLKLMHTICGRQEVAVEDAATRVVKYTTDEEALSGIPSDEVPSAALILEHRVISKLLSTYIEPVVSRKIICKDGLIRSKYSAMTAVTGRLAAEDPNAQNWPKRKHIEVRGIVAANAGDLMLACDYGQIEFRVVGMASEDRNLVKYCWTGYDVHAYWAQRMLEEYGAIKDYIVKTWPDILKMQDPDKAIAKTWRQEAKNGWVFPQLFGSSVRSCAEQLHMPLDVMADLSKEFWNEFSGVKKWQDKLMRDYEKNLYVETLGGRRRRGPMTRNEIINCPIQGTAADIVTESMNVCSEEAEMRDDPDLQPDLNVHDDLTFFMPEAHVEAKMNAIAAIMCLPRFDYINVPLVIECSAGYRWHQLDKIKDFRSDVIYNTPNPYKD